MTINNILSNIREDILNAIMNGEFYIITKITDEDIKSKIIQTLTDDNFIVKEKGNLIWIFLIDDESEIKKIMDVMVLS